MSPTVEIVPIHSRVQSELYDIGRSIDFLRHVIGVPIGETDFRRLLADGRGPHIHSYWGQRRPLFRPADLKSWAYANLHQYIVAGPSDAA